MLLPLLMNMGMLGSGSAVVVATATAGSGEITTWEDEVQARFRRTHLKEVVEKKELELVKVEKKIKVAEKKYRATKAEGILANLHLLETKKDEIRNEIRGFKLELAPLDLFLKKMEEDEEDERDIEMLLLS